MSACALIWDAGQRTGRGPRLSVGGVARGFRRWSHSFSGSTPAQGVGGSRASHTPQDTPLVSQAPAKMTIICPIRATKTRTVQAAPAEYNYSLGKPNSPSDPASLNSRDGDPGIPASTATDAAPTRKLCPEYCDMDSAAYASASANKTGVRQQGANRSAENVRTQMFPQHCHGGSRKCARHAEVARPPDEIPCTPPTDLSETT